MTKLKCMAVFIACLAVLAILVPLGQASAESTGLSLDIRSTFLTTDSGDVPHPPAIVDLGAFGFAPGTDIYMTITGEGCIWPPSNPSALANCPMSVWQLPVVGLFSESTTVYEQTAAMRVPDAIDSGNDFVTYPTYTENRPSDIPEDFRVIPSGLLITVPDGAKYLMLGYVDSRYWDNWGTLTITISTVAAPIADAGPDQTVELTSCSGADVTLDGSGSYDPDGDELTYIWTWNGGSATGVNPTITLPYGKTTVTLIVDDGLGGTATDMVNINVVDTTPVVVSVSVTPNLLWPPNHKYVEVVPSISVSDACVDEATVELVSVTSNEPDNGFGDGNTVNDIVINADGTISLRAEHSGNGSGRIYTITYRATDIAGTTTTASATVTVPHSR